MCIKNQKCCDCFLSLSYRNTRIDHCATLMIYRTQNLQQNKFRFSEYFYFGHIYHYWEPFFNSIDDRAYEFSQEELIAQSEIEDTILCPGHQARLRLSQLAPDIVLGDLDPKFNLVMEKFVFIPRYVKLELGDYYST